MTTLRAVALASTLLFVLLLAVPHDVSAATYVVSKIADTNDGVCDGDCSLREAIAAANATSDMDTVVVPQGDYTLSASFGEIGLGDGLVIQGEGIRVTRVFGASISQPNRVFAINGPNTVQVSDVEIGYGGDGTTTSGGAILNNGGNLTLRDCIVGNSHAQSGGGIFNFSGSTLTLVRTTVSDNEASVTDGGGIMNDGGTVVLQESTVSGNTAAQHGGGISSVFFGTPTVTAQNSTLSGNTAATEGGGLWASNGTVNLTNVTVAANSAATGGGIFKSAGATVALVNTLLAGNTGSNCSGGVTSGGHNLDDATSCGLGAAGDQSNADARLDILDYDERPTQTHALLAGSAAIDAGDTTVCTANDQVGNARNDGNGDSTVACDVGALEFAPSSESGNILTDGSEFRVNTNTAGSQLLPTVAAAPGQGFVVVWNNALAGHHGQRFDSNGAPVGPELTLNTNGDVPAVAMNSQGEFVVAWDAYSSLAGVDIFARKFDSTGNPIGAVFQLNEYTTGDQTMAGIAAGPNDEFVVVWTSALQDGDNDGVFGRRLDAFGAPAGNEFMVNSFTTSAQRTGFSYASPRPVAFLPNGDFLVVYESFGGAGGSGLDIFARHFTPSAVPIAPEYRVNTFTPYEQAQASITRTSMGDFVVVWSDYLTRDVARKLDSSGTPVGNEIILRELGSIATPTAVPDGGSLVTGVGVGGVPFNINTVAQRLDSSARRAGDTFQLNTYTPLAQQHSQVAADGTGRFLVVWDSDQQDGSSFGIYGQLLCYDGNGDAICDTAGQLDSDGDGVADTSDNCSTNANPDQLNSDCPDPSFFTSGGCSGSVPSTNTGCCDGGDVCDACPAYADNTRCDSTRSVAGNIGPAGGVLNTAEVSGTISATLVIPPNALSTDTSISMTENGPASGSTLFTVKEAGAASDVLSISVRPENQAFNLPVSVTLRWDDRDTDGLVDGGVCRNGPSSGLPCDHDADCGTGNACSSNANILESDLVLKRNNARFSKDGFGVSPFTCADHLSGACATATANCADAAGTGQATVAKCCDPGDGPQGTRTYGEWTFETCDFSEFLVGLTASGLVPGMGNTKTDCVLEWAVNNPLNPRYRDAKGLPNMKQECRDGDPVCDRDSLADGKCTFEVGICLTVDDPRLQKKGIVECAASDVAVFEISKPSIDDSDTVNQVNALALLSAAQSLGTNSSVSGRVTYAPAISQPSSCSDLVHVAVPVGKSTLKVRTETSPPPGKSRGAKDADTLKLTCLPSF